MKFSRRWPPPEEALTEWVHISLNNRNQWYMVGPGGNACKLISKVYYYIRLKCLNYFLQSIYIGLNKYFIPHPK